MRFAEVFLRLGLGLVAWMMLYAHLLWLAALQAMGCGPDGDEMHKLLLGLAPITVGFAFALRATRPFPEIHSMLRWLGVPLLLLLPFAAQGIWRAFESANINGSAVCGGGAPATWQYLWAPAQVVTLLMVFLMVFRVWRSVRQDIAAKKST